jgi:hypothetical protein
MNCPKGCILHGKPAEMKNGKITTKRGIRKLRKYCPVCFEEFFIDEPKKI